MLAPIVLFVYNRPDHAARTIASLQANRLATRSDLIIYSDAPKPGEPGDRVGEVRALIRQVQGFKSVTIVERDTNYGLARSIIDGVTAVVNTSGRIIVLEDDIVTSPFFLQYMNDALDRFADDERVVSVHGYTYPVKKQLPEAFFLPGADCWGWATWRRGWACFNEDARFLLEQLRRRGLMRALDYNGAYPYTRMLERKMEGKNDSWAICWYASAFLAEKLTLYPGRSLVHNIGNDSSGTHSGTSPELDAVLSATPIRLEGIAIQPCHECRQAFEAFFRKMSGGGWRRMIRLARKKIARWI
jgi:hypothetical protein